MRSVLITGAAGFIGSHLVQQMLQMGYTVYGVDNFDDYYPAALKRRNIGSLLNFGQFNFIEADIRNSASLQRQLPECIDVVVHLAAKAGVRYSIMFPKGYEETNVQGTEAIFRLSKSLHAQKFIFTSSSSIYGNNPHIPWSEDMDAMPDNPYAKTKWLSEQQLKYEGLAGGMDICVARLFSVYGPRMRPDLMMNRIYESLINGAVITVFGDGSSTRDYTYIDDIVRGIIACTETPQKNFCMYNLGNEHPVKLLQVIKIFEYVTGRVARLDFLPEVQGESKATCADISKAKKELNYSPSVSIEDGIERFVNWKNENHDICAE